MPDTATTETPFPCPNCGGDLHADDHFCARCGQSIKDLQRPITALIGELLTSLFSLDAKLWTTLFDLLLRPGRLTRQFIEGKRRAQVPPLRLYLFISLIYFLLTGVQVDRQFREMARDETLGPGRTIQDIDTLNLLDLQITVAGARQLEQMTLVQRDSVLHAQDLEPTAINRFLLDRAPRLADLHGIERLTLRSLQYFSHALFLLMPALGLVLWSFFKRSRHWYFEHLIHAIHLHAFYFFVQSILLSIELLTSSELPSLGILALLVYLPISMRVVYGHRWPATLGLAMMVMFVQAIVIGVAFLASALTALWLL